MRIIRSQLIPILSTLNFNDTRNIIYDIDFYSHAKYFPVQQVSQAAKETTNSLTSSPTYRRGALVAIKPSTFALRCMSFFYRRNFSVQQKNSVTKEIFFKRKNSDISRSNFCVNYTEKRTSRLLLVPE